MACGPGDPLTFDPAVSDDEAAICVEVPATEKVEGKLWGLPTRDVPVDATREPRRVKMTPPPNHWQMQVGVLALSPDWQDMLAIEHVLAPMGIPYAQTTAPKLALQHDIAMFFPDAYEESFHATDIEAMGNFIGKGGVLVWRDSDVTFLRDLAGVPASTFGLPHHVVRLTKEGEAAFPSLDQPEEREIPLGGGPEEFLNTWTLEVDPTAEGVVVLATFEDGSPAIVRRNAGPAVIYTMGVDFRDVVIRNQLGYPLDGAARGYINVFEPATDAWLLMMRDIYDAHARFGVRLHTAPNGLSGALLISHDLDWGPSYDRSAVYAEREAALGASTTYFAHTKYVDDVQDHAFFSRDRGCQLASFLRLGHAVGSHSVAHSKMLHLFEVGDGAEAYPSYAPYNVSPYETQWGTLYGELRVSKSLIDGSLDAARVSHETQSFRAGELSYHPESPLALERVGYRTDSTQAVGVVLTNFPYRLMTSLPEIQDTDVFELPVTLEDELPPRLDLRVEQALGVITQNARNGAPTSLLIHPNVTDYKLAAEEMILAKLPEGVAAMSVDAFARFWRARDAVTFTLIDYNVLEGTLTISLRPEEAIEGLTLRVDEVLTSVSEPAGAVLSPPKDGGRLLVLPALEAGQGVDVVLHY
ncbi:hypothetical protein [Polyangium jinanense]|uniref:Uncharacterized protein n=1 Tax=Polyangium jinanense TaxID=2829994 RepID=A0A9X3XHQ8_9BACT|nr:hypothetical protein [Polyangium jinanense]MDC3962134.1 hypothetical protein [Polyangium jinanense]MDC3989550.1 hypothetical protein [Polyangium jinanense]